jgi:hypothetical protein
LYTYERNQLKERQFPMRYLLLLVLLLCSKFPVHAQGDDPLYIQCGAEEYLIERYYILTIDDETQASFDEGEPTLEKWGAHMLNTIKIRDTFFDMQEVPECVAELHQLTIKREFLSLDYEAFAFASSAFFADNSDFRFYAGQKAEQIKQVNEDIDAELIRLGWLTEDFEYTNKPPTVTPAPTEEE